MAERVCDRAAENLGISHLLPARPNKPVSAYFEYLRAVRLEFSRNNPALSKTQAKISQVAAKRWKESEQERVPYVAQYEKNREAHSAAAAEYRAKLETFQETPVGQQWIAEQGRIRKRHHESTFDDELEELYAEEGVRQLPPRGRGRTLLPPLHPRRPSNGTGRSSRPMWVAGAKCWPSLPPRGPERHAKNRLRQNNSVRETSYPSEGLAPAGSG